MLFPFTPSHHDSSCFETAAGMALDLCLLENMEHNHASPQDNPCAEDIDLESGLVVKLLLQHPHSQGIVNRN